VMPKDFVVCAEALDIKSVLAGCSASGGAAGICKFVSRGRLCLLTYVRVV
jgi:hypothetical protein